MNGLHQACSALSGKRGNHRVPLSLREGPRHARIAVHAAVTVLGLALFCTVLQAQELTVRLVGNAGVLLTDGETSLLIDLPYQSGAFGYMHYDPAQLQPAGTTVSVITHHHEDHFDPSLFVARTSWRIIGPSSVTAAVPSERVLHGDSLEVGRFAIVVIPSSHTEDHRSYRVRWREQVLHFSGDTEQVNSVPGEPYIDVLFVTPWLQCALTNAARTVTWRRTVVYHRQVDGSDRICGVAELMDQGAEFVLQPRADLERA